jgi:molybdopterin converting factor small subunit
MLGMESFMCRLLMGAGYHTLCVRENMKISVKLFANLVQRVSKDGQTLKQQGIRAGMPMELELPDNSTLADLLALLELEKGDVVITFVDGRARKLGYHLSHGEQVGIFPPLGGG